MESLVDILSCTEMKSFWITWQEHNSGLVQVGKGQFPGNNQLLQYSADDIIPINAISVTTGTDTTGLWQIPVAQGSDTLYSRPII